MNYQEHYDRLVSRAKERKLDCYTESHHIVPKCMGGTDDKDNLILLTAREHFIAHLLLMKIHPESYGLIYALNMMCVSNVAQHRSMNRMYGWLKEKFSISQKENQKGEKNSQFGSMWISHPEKRINKKIRDNIIPDGWCKGRNVWVKIEKKEAKRNKEKLLREAALNHFKNFIDSEYITIKAYAESINYTDSGICGMFKTHIPGYSTAVTRRKRIDKEHLRVIYNML